MNPTIPTTEPVRLAKETWLIPNLAAAGPDAFVPVNTMVIRGDAPVIVDTGAAVHHDLWVEKVFSLVDPDDVRYIFLSHDDGDHVGGLRTALELCPTATVVSNFFMHERLELESHGLLPLDRMVWLGPGESFDAGDRRLRLVVPPIFDGPTTRGVFDGSTGVLWAVDSFAALTTGAVHHVDDLPAELYDESFALFNSLVSPWHQWLDPVAYGRHIDELRGVGATVVASAHGPILTGHAIGDAFDRVRAMAGKPIVQPPGQPALDEIVAAALAVAS